jgi:hypothetical protein
MGQTTIRSTKGGTRVTTRVKSGTTTVTRTTSAGKKPKDNNINARRKDDLH